MWRECGSNEIESIVLFVLSLIHNFMTDDEGVGVADETAKPICKRAAMPHKCSAIPKFGNPLSSDKSETCCTQMDPCPSG